MNGWWNQGISVSPQSEVGKYLDFLVFCLFEGLSDCCAQGRRLELKVSTKSELPVDVYFENNAFTALP